MQPYFIFLLITCSINRQLFAQSKSIFAFTFKLKSFNFFCSFEASLGPSLCVLSFLLQTLTSVHQKSTTAVLMLNVLMSKDHITAHVTLDILETDELVWVNVFQTDIFPFLQNLKKRRKIEELKRRSPVKSLKTLSFRLPVCNL